jgi:hypothetical protein
MRDASGAERDFTIGAVAVPLAGDEPLDPVEQRLEVDVPDPRDILAVRDGVVQGDRDDPGRGTRDERAHGLVRPSGILDQQDEQAPFADWDPLEAAERGGEPLESLHDLVEGSAERQCEGARGERVVDVVKPRQPERDAADAVRSAEVEGHPVQPGELDPSRHDVKRRARVPAGRAAVVTEVAHVGGRIFVRRSAEHAVLRVRRVLKRRSRLARVVDAEGDRAVPLAGEVADLRVVSIDDEHRVGSEVAHRGAPALGDVFQLAVAVELVAEEVPEADRTRTNTPRDLREGALVDLQQAQLRVVSGQQRRRDARDEVRAGVVVGEADARAEDRRRHRRGRRLAVRRGHER